MGPPKWGCREVRASYLIAHADLADAASVRTSALQLRHNSQWPQHHHHSYTPSTHLHITPSLDLFPPPSAAMPLVDPVTTPPASSVSSKTSEAPQPQPIHLHPTPASQAARHVLPVVFGGLLLAAFPSLVANPVPVMRNSLPVVFALQALYAFVCLPMAGSGTGKSRKPRPGEKKKAGDSSGPNFIIVRLPELPLLFWPTIRSPANLFLD